MNRVKKQKNKVIAYRNLPGKLPWGLTFLVIYLLDKFKADGWLCGVAGTLVTIIWIICLVGKANQQEVDVFNKNDMNDDKANT